MNRVVHLSSASHDFVAYAKSLVATRFKASDAARYPGVSSRVKEVLTKVGVASGAPDGSTWGSELVGYAELSTGFAASLAPWSAYACAAQDQDLNCIKRSDVMAIKELILEGVRRKLQKSFSNHRANSMSALGLTKEK